MHSYVEAIECHKRALIGADKDDTSSHHALAQMYEQVGEMTEAAAYHRRCVDIAQRAGKPVQTYSKNAIELARYEMLKGWWPKGPLPPAIYPEMLPDGPQPISSFDGNMMLAKEYLEMISTSNCAEVKEAEDLLRVWKKFVIE